MRGVPLSKSTQPPYIDRRIWREHPLSLLCPLCEGRARISVVCSDNNLFIPPPRWQNAPSLPDANLNCGFPIYGLILIPTEYLDTRWDGRRRRDRLA